MNKVLLTGNLCKDIQKQTTTNGVTYSQNCLGVQRSIKDAEGNYITDFINIVLWRQQAEYLEQYASKGDLVEVVGSWTVRKYQDDNGNTKLINECLVEHIKILRNKPQEAKQPLKEATESNDDLPF